MIETAIGLRVVFNALPRYPVVFAINDSNLLFMVYIFNLLTVTQLILSPIRVKGEAEPEESLNT